MRNSFRHGAPALVPKTGPRSYTQRPRTENEREQVADHGLSTRRAPTGHGADPHPQTPCISVWPMEDLTMGGEGTGDCYTAAATAVATTPWSNHCPMEFAQEAGRVQRAASGREVATP